MTKRIVSLALAAALIIAALVVVLLGTAPKKVRSETGKAMTTPEEVYVALGYSGPTAYRADMAVDATPVCVQHAYFVSQDIGQTKDDKTTYQANKVQSGVLNLYIVGGAVYAQSKGKVVTNSSQMLSGSAPTHSSLIEYDAELYIAEGATYVRYATYRYMDADTPDLEEPSADSKMAAAFGRAVEKARNRWIAVEGVFSDEQQAAFADYMQYTITLMFDWEKWSTAVRNGLNTVQPATGGFDWSDAVRQLAASLPVEAPADGQNLYKGSLADGGSITLLLDSPARPAISQNGSMQTTTNQSAYSTTISSDYQLSMVISGLDNTAVDIDTGKAIALADIAADATKQEGGAQ